MKRTNVVLDENLMEEAKTLSGIKYTKDVIHEAVGRFVKNQRRRRILEIPKDFRWEGDLTEMRKSRNYE